MAAQQQVSDPKELHPVAPVLEGQHTFASVTDKISSIVLTQRSGWGWFLGLGLSFMLLMLLFAAVGYLFAVGVGIWGINIPVAWGFAITNFVWWIGIGHAGTLISAILLLLRQRWRTSINRFAEAMTLFAVACAGLFPILHLGRPWLFYWLIPYPTTMGVWPQFRSPLMWDFFAVSTYGTVSLLFWYIGLIPDLATLRDRARNRFSYGIYGILAMGWRGDAAHWQRYETAYVLLAGLATPLVVSVHTIVSFDFAVANVPGWHSTIFPPYFVAGAIFSGFAMVATLAIPLRKFYHLEEFITLRHIDYMARIMLATGLMVGYGYLMESFYAWYSGNTFEQAIYWDRAFGAYGPLYWALVVFNVVVPQAFWFRRVRTNVPLVFVLALLINVGMWLERYVIVVQSLHASFVPASWHIYLPTFWDYATFIGTIGLFLTLLFLFIRFLPMISIFELRELVEQTGKRAGGPRQDDAAPKPQAAGD